MPPARRAPLMRGGNALLPEPKVLCFASGLRGNARRWKQEAACSSQGRKSSLQSVVTLLLSTAFKRAGLSPCNGSKPDSVSRGLFAALLRWPSAGSFCKQVGTSALGSCLQPHPGIFRSCEVWCFSPEHVLEAQPGKAFLSCVPVTDTAKPLRLHVMCRVCVWGGVCSFFSNTFWVMFSALGLNPNPFLRKL